jgi:hypothetical protein
MMRIFSVSTCAGISKFFPSLTGNNIVTLKKALSFQTIPFLPRDEEKYCSTKKTYFLFSIPIGPDQAPSRSHFLSPRADLLM